MTLNKELILDVVYPVGAIYMSVNSTNPSTLFGGTWVSIGNNMKLIDASGDIPVITGTEHNEATEPMTIKFKSSNYDRILASHNGYIEATTGSGTYYDNSQIRPTNLYAKLAGNVVNVYMWKRTS